MPQKNPVKKPAKLLLTQESEQPEDLKQLFGSRKGGELLNIESIPIAICITNKNGSFIQANQFFCDFLGYSRNELLGRHFSILLPETESDTSSKLHHTFMRGDPQGGASEIRVTNKSGRHCYVITHAAQITDGRQEACTATFFMDITHIKESELQYKRSSEDLHHKLDQQELTESMLMHDVHKPVANIIGICNLLLKADFDQLKFINWIKILNYEAEKSLRLLDAKAGFKRMELKTYEVLKQDFDVLQLIRTILNPLEPQIQEKELHLRLALEGEECQAGDSLIISADEFFVEIMLNNLITNALEASPVKSAVNIQLFIKNKNDLQTDIHNKGAIPLAVRHNFFNKYSTAGKARGLGMGTYTAKIIANAHGGDITFITSKKEGTTLHIVLPGVIKSKNLRREGKKLQNP